MALMIRSPLVPFLYKIMTPAITKMSVFAKKACHVTPLDHDTVDHDPVDHDTVDSDTVDSDTVDHDPVGRATHGRAPVSCASSELHVWGRGGLGGGM